MYRGVGQFENCDPLDGACLVRNQDTWAAVQAAQAARNQDVFRANCEAHNTANPNYKRDCDAMYPAVDVARAVESHRASGDWAAGSGVFTSPSSGKPTAAPALYTAPVNPTQIVTQASSPLPPSAAASGGGTGTGADPAPTARLLNLTRAGDPNFRVGDRWRIEITGAPNRKVTNTATQNGAAMGTTGYGSTNSAGVFTLEGSMGSAHTGQWTEVWRVGDLVAHPVLSFEVRQAETVAAGGNGATAPGGSTTFRFELPDTLSEQSIISGVPNWALLAAGLAGAYFLARGNS